MTMCVFVPRDTATVLCRAELKTANFNFSQKNIFTTTHILRGIARIVQETAETRSRRMRAGNFTNSALSIVLGLGGAGWLGLAQLVAAEQSALPEGWVLEPSGINTRQPTSPAKPGNPGEGSPLAMPPHGPPIPAGTLAWDAEALQVTVTRGTPRTSFTFSATNMSPGPVVITSIRSTCGCTVPKLPEKMPWTLVPGSKNTFAVEMNLAGKRGTVSKSVILITDRGHQTLQVRVDIAEPPAAGINRERNLQIAMVNRQEVLRGECAACHATPALGKMGAKLFQNACAICHESDQRAESVPDLRLLAKPKDASYWRSWITTSAEGKLMPAFGIDHGGILTREQIDSLVAYLTKTIPASLPSQNPTPKP